ncbi:methionyl-tRNA formyltransferase [Candidatus Peregrinibacteria bacterium]|nr:methionyl-tRNA formyltransferase [Candidatus Peregrinibacteria bacterium]
MPYKESLRDSSFCRPVFACGERPVKVIFFSSGEFGIPILGSLASDPSFEILAVVTQPDKPAGRSQKITPTVIKIFAEGLGLSVISPDKIKGNKDFEDLLKKMSLDFIVAVSYGQIIPRNILDIPRITAINIHGSLLPRYRGASPIQTALLNGDKETGITIMEMNEKMDEGDVYLIKRVPIEDSDDFSSLMKKLSMLAGEIIPHALKDITDGNLKKIKQDDSRATYCAKIEKNMAKLDCKKLTAAEVHNHIRAFAFWPNCSVLWNKKLIIIHKAKTAPNKEKTPSGSIIFPDKNTMAIACSSGLLIPEIVQLEGKKPIPIKEFINGYKTALVAHPFVE